MCHLRKTRVPTKGVPCCYGGSLCRATAPRQRVSHCTNCGIYMCCVCHAELLLLYGVHGRSYTPSSFNKYVPHVLLLPHARQLRIRFKDLGNWTFACMHKMLHTISISTSSKQHTMPYRIAESTATIHILLPKRKYYTNRAKMVGVEKLLQKRLIKKVIKAKTGLTTRRLLLR